MLLFDMAVSSIPHKNGVGWLMCELSGLDEMDDSVLAFLAFRRSVASSPRCEPGWSGLDYE